MKQRIQLNEHFTYGKLLRFALPSIIMMIFTSVYGVVDGLFVSNYVGKTAFASVNLIMPFIICTGAIGFMLGTGGSAIVGKNAVVGNSTELKNVVLFDNVQVPHYNYVGDSILGYKAHMGAGSITSNVKSDKTLVTVHIPDAPIETGRKKFGAILGDNVEVGCNSVLNPGTVVGRCSNIYPVSCVRGVVPANSIYKAKDNIVAKK